MVIVQETVQYF